MDLVGELFADYNRYRLHTHSILAVQRAKKIKISPLHATSERFGALREMALFCIEHGADPRIWLYTLFDARGWSYPPPWDQLSSKAHLTRYAKAHHLGFLTQSLLIQRQRKRRARGDTFDPNRDVSPSVEAIKAVYVRTGRTQQCIDQMARETYGFHPQSEVCGACPAQLRCAQVLCESVHFDILALRRGEITAQAAERAARLHYRDLLTKDTMYAPRRA